MPQGQSSLARPFVPASAECVMMRRNMSIRLCFILLIVISSARNARAAAPAPAPPKPLPAETSRYNRGDFAGRYRDEKGKPKQFALRHGDAPLYDGGGR